MKELLEQPKFNYDIVASTSDGARDADVHALTPSMLHNCRPLSKEVGIEFGSHEAWTESSSVQDLLRGRDRSLSQKEGIAVSY